MERIERTTSNWRHSRISLDGKTILIDSSILSIPMYFLLVYPTPDTILENISKVSRKFFWCRGSNRKGICSVSWKDITLGSSGGSFS